MTAISHPPFSSRRFVLLGLFTLAILFAGLGLWSVATRLSGAVVAQGQIKVDRDLQVVQHQTGGTVTHLWVQNGDTVRTGQRLLQFDATTLVAQRALLKTELYEITARRLRAQAEADDLQTPNFAPLIHLAGSDIAKVHPVVSGQQHVFHARRSSYLQEIEQSKKRAAQVASQIGGLTVQISAIYQHIALIEADLANQKTLLARGLTQSSRVHALQRERARLSGLLGERQAQQAQAGAQQTEIEISILQLGNHRREQALTHLRDLRFRESELRQQLQTVLKQIQAMTVTAPMAGTVHDLRLSGAQAVVSAAQPIMSLIPKNRSLVVFAHINPKNIDRVHVGQQVQLRFTSFDRPVTPTVQGRVHMISGDVVSATPNSAPSYRVEIQIPATAVQELSTGTTLLPGMPVDTYLLTGNHTPLTYVLKPLSEFFHKALRE